VFRDPHPRLGVIFADSGANSQQFHNQQKGVIAMCSTYFIMRALATVALATVLCQTDFAWSQQAIGPATGSAQKGVLMRVAELQQVRGPGLVPEVVPRYYPGDASATAQLKRKAQEPFSGRAQPERDGSYANENGTGIEGLGTNFQGISWTTSIPPDPVIAAGPNHVVLVVNSRLAIYTKSGSLVSQTELYNWFANVNPPGTVFDPKVIYDQHASR